MSNSGKWNPVSFDELQAGDRVQVKIEETQQLGSWLRRTVDKGEFVIGRCSNEGWLVDDNPAEIAVMSHSHIRANVKQIIFRYVPPFEFPLALGTVFSGQHYEAGRHTFVVADYLAEDDTAIYRNVSTGGWQDREYLIANYSDFQLGEA